VKLLLNRPLVSAKNEAGQILSIDLQTGETVRAKVFVDATYEGDLLAAANVSYHVGREPAATYNESLQMGLDHFLANDPQVPEELRGRVKHWGLDPREFPDTGHWPHQLYIREGRRMLSDYVMTQANCERERVAEDSIGLASYPMDSHFCQRVVVEIGKTTVRNEGGFGHKCKNGPYPVAYRSIVPKKGECSNLLVPVSLSASHAAFGSIRMEPVFMILGQSAGTAAALAIDGNQAVQDVPYEKLKELLVKHGQRL
jgi:hypothetical protein